MDTDDAPRYRCGTCGAPWDRGQHTDGCDECAGGAFDRPCVICGGRCGARWTRAVHDSNDAGLGHWIGVCALPAEEQRAIMNAALQRARRRD